MKQSTLTLLLLSSGIGLSTSQIDAFFDAIIHGTKEGTCYFARNAVYNPLKHLLVSTRDLAMNNVMYYAQILRTNPLELRKQISAANPGRTFTLERAQDVCRKNRLIDGYLEKLAVNAQADTQQSLQRDSAPSLTLVPSDGMNEHQPASSTFETIKSALPAIVNAGLSNQPAGSIARPVMINLNLNETHVHATATAISEQTAPVIADHDTNGSVTHQAQQLCSSAFHWVQNHKIRFSLYCFGAFYIGVQAYLAYLSNVLASGSCWSRWKNQCTLEELYRIKQSDLLRDLIHSIELAYGAQIQHGNPVLRVVQFMQEADVELGQLQRYQSVVCMVEKTGLRRICFYNALLAREAADRIRRLQFIKNTAYGWLNELRGTQSYSALFDHQQGPQISST